MLVIYFILVFAFPYPENVGGKTSLFSQTSHNNDNYGLAPPDMQTLQ